MASRPQTSLGQPVAAEGRCVRLLAKADDVASIAPSIERRTLSRAADDEVLIEVKAAAVNPSDAKAATGLMPYAVFPRTPGFAARRWCRVARWRHELCPHVTPAIG